MKIEKYHFAKGEALVVNGSIHFDYNFAFCGRPYIHLNAYCGRKYQIGVGIRDNDDFDIGCIYTAEKKLSATNGFLEIKNQLTNTITLAN